MEVLMLAVCLVVGAPVALLACIGLLLATPEKKWQTRYINGG